MERLRTPGFGRALLWGSALVLIAGVVAFITVSLGNNDSSPAAADRGTVPSGYASEDLPGVDTQTTPKESDVPKAAREAAGAFVLAAVGREDLAKGWTLADKDLRASCACTREEWLTGNIPVQYFPTKGLKGAAFSVDEVTPGHVVLQVLPQFHCGGWNVQSLLTWWKGGKVVLKEKCFAIAPVDKEVAQTRVWEKKFKLNTGK